MKTNKIIQLDFFKDPDISRLEHEVYLIKESANKVRRKLFAKVGQLQTMYDDLHTDLEMLKRNICRGEKYVARK